MGPAESIPQHVAKEKLIVFIENRKKSNGQAQTRDVVVAYASCLIYVDRDGASLAQCSIDGHDVQAPEIPMVITASGRVIPKNRGKVGQVLLSKKSAQRAVSSSWCRERRSRRV